MACIFAFGQAQEISTTDVMPLSTSVEIQKEFNDARIHYYNYLDLKSLKTIVNLTEKDPKFALPYLWKTLTDDGTKNLQNHYVKKAEKFASHATVSELAYIKTWRYFFDEKTKLDKQYNTLTSQKEKENFDWSKMYEVQLHNLEKLVSIHPGDIFLRMNYATALSNTGNYKKAIEIYNSVLTISDEIFAIHNLLGYLYLDKKDYVMAKREFTTYIEKLPNAANPYDSMGDYYFSTQNYKKAVKYYDKAYNMNPNFTFSKDKAIEARSLLNKK